MTNRVDYVRELIFQEIRSINNASDREYYSLHLYTVSCLSALLAKQRHIDVELAMIAGLLHDIHSLRHGYSEFHGPLGAIEAKELLVKSGLFFSQEIEGIIDAIEKHSNKDTHDCAFAEVLKDADILEAYLRAEKNRLLMGTAKISRITKMLDIHIT